MVLLCAVLLLSGFPARNATPILAAAPQAAQQQAPPAAQAYAQGEEYLSKKDFAHALEAYDRAIKLDPKQPEFYLEKCRALSNLQRYSEAVTACSEALRLRPNYAMALRDRGHVYINLGRNAEALADLKQAAAANPGDRDTQYHLGIAYYLSGDFQNAAVAFNGCLRDARQPNEIVECSAWLYPSLRRSGQDAAARQLLDKIQPNWPIQGATSYYYDRLLLFKGTKSEAQLAATAKKDGALSEATVDYNLGLWQMLNGNKVKAREDFQRAIASGAKNSFGYRAAEQDLKRLK